MKNLKNTPATVDGQSGTYHYGFDNMRDITDFAERNDGFIADSVGRRGAAVSSVCARILERPFMMCEVLDKLVSEDDEVATDEDGDCVVIHCGEVVERYQPYEVSFTFDSTTYHIGVFIPN